MQARERKWCPWTGEGHPEWSTFRRQLSAEETATAEAVAETANRLLTEHFPGFSAHALGGGGCGPSPSQAAKPNPKAADRSGGHSAALRPRTFRAQSPAARGGLPLRSLGLGSSLKPALPKLRNGSGMRNPNVTQHAKPASSGKLSSNSQPYFKCECSC